MDFLDTFFYSKAYPHVKKIEANLINFHWLHFGKHLNLLPNSEKFFDVYKDFSLNEYKNLNLKFDNDEQYLAKYWNDNQESLNKNTSELKNNFIIKNINGKNLYYFNDFFKYQYPVITERRILELFLINNEIPNNFFSFPWASLIDEELSTNWGNKNYDNIKKYVENIKINEETCFTVVQHYLAKNVLDIIKKIGITHVFFPHNIQSNLDLEKEYNIKILPLSLYPVQNNEMKLYSNINTKRKYFFSFIGAYDPKVYISDIRPKIFDLYGSKEDCLISKRGIWHYNKVVYNSQIFKDKIQHKTDSALEDEYKYILNESIFSLCPSGAGPNSIRIWEAMSFGSIPVILADGLKLPLEHEIDYTRFLIVYPEKDIEKLYDFLKSYDDNQINKMREKCIEYYNNYFSTNSIHKLIKY